MINIRELRSEDIPEVVNIHREAIGYSLNARLGSRHLSNIYACVKKSESAIVNVAEVDGIICGVVSAATNPEKLSSEIIKSLSFKQKLLLAINFIIRPWQICNIREHRHLSLPVAYKSVQVSACLTVLAVAPQHRGKGISKTLITSVEDYFKSQNINYYRLDTFSTNTNARTFYNYLGFDEIGQVGRNVILVKEISQKLKTGKL